MAEVFADTAGWASFFLRTEPFHATARSLMVGLRADAVEVVTTNYVLAELVALFTSPLRIPRTEQISVIDAIRSASWVEIFHVDRTLDDEAWDLLKTRTDKDWSLVDCASFALMHRRRISQALTTDHHFEQAGFLTLLH